MKPEKEKNNFNDLFSEINKGSNIEEPLFMKDLNKEKTNNSILKNTIKNVFSGVRESIGILYELKNKDYEINSEYSKEIIKILKSYDEDEEINYKMITSVFVFLSSLIVMFMSIMDLKYVAGITIGSIMAIIYNMAKRVNDKNMKIKAFNSDLEKIPVVFKSNKINFNMLVFSALKKENDTEFNNALKEQIDNVINGEEWIYLNKAKVNFVMLNKYISDIENKMINFK